MKKVGSGAAYRAVKVMTLFQISMNQKKVPRGASERLRPLPPVKWTGLSLKSLLCDESINMRPESVNFDNIPCSLFHLPLFHLPLFHLPYLSMKVRRAPNGTVLSQLSWPSNGGEVSEDEAVITKKEYEGRAAHSEVDEEGGRANNGADGGVVRVARKLSAAERRRVVASKLIAAAAGLATGALELDPDDSAGRVHHHRYPAIIKRETEVVHYELVTPIASTSA